MPARSRGQNETCDPDVAKWPAARNTIASPSLAVLAALLFCMHFWVNTRQPKPYMDELFHVPQAQEFCVALRSSRFPTYHAAITTPPGPYLLPVLLGTLFPALCTTSGLRAFSACCIFLIAVQISSILSLLRSRLPEALARARITTVYHPSTMLEALVLVLHPPLFFYSSLVYTDPPATLFMLICFRYALDDRHVASAAFGVLSALCRQTSAMFHAFIAFDSVLYGLRTQMPQGPLFRRLFRVAAPHTFAGLAYLALFRANGYKVAIGDAVNHPISLHYAMFAYHSGYCALFAFPVLFACGAFRPSSLQALSHTCRDQLRFWQWRILVAVLVGLFTSLVVATGAKVHPFVLADNRHYIFYVYRKILLRGSAIRLALIPIYTGALFGLFSSISYLCAQAESMLTKKTESARIRMVGHIRMWYWFEVLTESVLALCIALCVVPSSLLEPRYFVPGWMLVALRACARYRMRGLYAQLAALALVLVNIGLVFVFCELPFVRPVDKHMPSDLSLGRFMF